MTLEGSFLICPTGRKYGAAGLAETVSGAASRDDRIFVVKVYFKIETCLDCHAVKKVCLVHCIWRAHIELGARNVLWRGEINLLKGLFD